MTNNNFQVENGFLGGWVTPHKIDSVDFVQNTLAVTPDMKPAGITHVQELIIQPGTPVNFGVVGSQTSNGIVYSGGGLQYEVLVPPTERNSVLIKVGEPWKIDK